MYFVSALSSSAKLTDVEHSCPSALMAKRRHSGVSFFVRGALFATPKAPPHKPHASWRACLMMC
jgi:hypothetical protein